MKSILTTFIASSIAITTLAGVHEGEGYYRVQNYLTARYVYVTDNRGSLNFQATTAELGAIELWKGEDKTISDPASVIYIKDLDGKGRDFDLQTQGTGVKTIIDYPVSIIENKSTKPLTHRIFGRNSGLTRYIGDGTGSDAVIDLERGYASSQLPGGDKANLWLFKKISTSDNYFGITPDLRNGNEYYSTIYAGFPFSLASQGMKAYYITKVGNGMAAIKEISGTVPAGTPVIVKCAASTASGNKLNVGGTASALSGNRLGGVYFNNTSLKHKNQTPYDKETMRVLGTLSDGSVGFVTSNTLKFLPRNKAYLTVPAGSPAEIRLVSEEEFDHASIISVNKDRVSVRIEDMTLIVEGDTPVEVYTVTGQLVRRGNFSSLLLPAPGIYIVKTSSTATKLIAR